MLINFQVLSSSEKVEIFNSVREICISKIPLPEQVFIDVAEGKLDDDNMDLKCFAHCIAKTLSFIKKSGDFDVEKFRNLAMKFVVTEDKKEDFEQSIELCINICMHLFYIL